MGVSGLALAAALAGAQPQCSAPESCPSADVSAAVPVAPGADVDAPAANPPSVADGSADPASGPATEAVPSDVPPLLPDQVDDQSPDALPSGQKADEPTTENTIVVTGETEEGDPAERINAATFDTVQKIDDAVVAPLAEAYDKKIPHPVRSGLRNFLRNLGEPISFLNFMLQLKPVRAFKALGRFGINSTIGVAGLFDVAKKKPFGIPYEFNGFANTLGFYGVGPGPYLYLPFIGSTTVRDLFGRAVDLSIIPVAVGGPFKQPLYSIPAGALNSLESRILIDDQIKAVRNECGDAYSATRDIYLIGRQAEIDGLRGKESKQLEKLVERLKVNCDLSVIRSATQLPLDLDAPATTATPTEPVPAASDQATPEPVAPATAIPIDTVDPTPDAAAPTTPKPANDTPETPLEPQALAG